MALLTASNVTVWGHTNLGPLTNGSNNPVFGCFISGTFSGTYAQADDARFSNANTAIANSRRDGKTVTLLDAAFFQPGDENGTPIGASSVTVSGGHVNLQLTGSDLTTEHSNAALGAMQNGPALFVCYVLS